MKKNSMKLASGSQFQLTRQVVGWLKPFLPRYVLLFFLSFLAVPLALLHPLPLMLVVDHIVGQNPISDKLLWLWPGLIEWTSAELLLAAVGITILTTLLQQVESYGNWLFQSQLGEEAALHLKERLFKHLVDLPSSYHKEIHSADSLYRLQSDIPAVSFIPIQWTIILSSFFTVTFMLIVTSMLSLKLALFSLAVIPILLILLKVYEPISRRQWGSVKSSETNFLAILKEAISNPLLLKAYRLEKLKAREIVSFGKASIKHQIQASVVESLFGSGIALVLAIGAAVILYVGTKQVMAEHLSLGSLILIMGYLALLYKPLESLAKKAATLQSALTSADRLWSTFQLKADTPSVQENLYQGPVEGAFQLTGVSVSYHSKREILQDLNLTIPKGSIVGISGPSGGGKTTLLQVLLGLIKVDKGQVCLDQRPLCEWNYETLRTAMTVLFQETVLFSGTIYDNLTIGLGACTPEQVYVAAKAANAASFIEKLPDAYQTSVGENGVKLSGGERQRLALARAFLRNSPILLLDEPTSQVDQENGQQIMAAIQALSRDRTTIMISHSHDCLDFCHIRYQLDQGCLTRLDSDV